MKGESYDVNRDFAGIEGLVAERHIFPRRVVMAFSFKGKKRLFTHWIALTFAMLLPCAKGMTEPDSFTIDARFLDSHDPGWMELQVLKPGTEADGLLGEPECTNLDFSECWTKREEWRADLHSRGLWLEVHYLYRTIDYETVSSWEEGAHVSLIYNDESGVQLVGPNGNHYKVYLPDFNVIQALDNDCNAEAPGVTVVMVHCNRSMAEMLDLEFLQSAKALMLTLEEPERLVVKNFVDSAFSTVASLEDAYKGLVASGVLEGSRHSYESRSSANELRRSHITQLWALFD